MNKGLFWLILVVGNCFSFLSFAQEENLESVVKQKQTALTKVEEEKNFLKKEAQKELKIGLKLYAEADDYRAISALKRYRILDASLSSRYFSNLIIGQIYHRNQKHELSTFAFENAFAAAPDDHAKVFTYLLANQQSCVALSYYFDCSKRLDGLTNASMGATARDLVDYQNLFVDIVLRREISEKRAHLIQTPLLRKKAKGLLLENAKFEELSLKSPILSGLFSAILPGAGQLYNGRPWDALLSLSFNAAFAGATYYSYKELDNIPLTIVSGLLFLGFYVGNITNAVTDSQKINANTYLNYFTHLKKNYWARVLFQIDEEQVMFGYKFDWPGPKAGLKRDLRELKKEK